MLVNTLFDLRTVKNSDFICSLICLQTFSSGFQRLKASKHSCCLPGLPNASKRYILRIVNEKGIRHPRDPDPSTWMKNITFFAFYFEFGNAYSNLFQLATNTKGRLFN